MKTHARAYPIAFHWPDKPFHIVLVEPEIPPNTGNIARLCAATGTILHLVEPLGFRLTNAALRRAGLDYWKAVELRRHNSWEAYLDQACEGRRHFFSTRGPRSLFDTRIAPGDALVFGNESRGLPDAILDKHPGDVVGIPMKGNSVRSLNLATAAGIVLYEALRQSSQGGPGGGEVPAVRG